MHQSHFLSHLKNPPQPADRERAATGLERWREAAERAEDPQLAAFAADLAGDPGGRALLEAVFGNSPFLTQCLLGEPDFARRLFLEGPDEVLSALRRDLRTDLAGEAATDRVMAALRRAKRRTALAVALADIAGYWPLAKVTAALTAFAETALAVATAHLLRRLADEGQLALADPADPERGSGFFVLAMGKLGAGELNYSSDIDLIVLYDDERVSYTGTRPLQDCFLRLTRELVRIMEERTSDGYVFRTDLRLRPDPGATPLAISALAAEVYYESMGQNWERAAMIKARPVAGDREAAAIFLERLVPYVWRKHLDFAAIQDIHSIKRQIDAFRGGGEIKVAGHDLKLGRGGIREIEFFAQTQQLIWGGRMPELRVADTCGALAALVAAGRIPAETARDLAEAYRFLRRVEHRLQMVEDLQTHTLPGDDAGVARIGVFAGFSGAEDFAAALLGHLRAVERHYAALFEEAPSLGGPGNLVFTGSEPDPETLETLAGLGFANPEAVSSAIMAWHRGRYPATRSVRARELLTELMPALLAALAKTADPAAALLKFDEFLSRLPAGVQLFSLFHSNPALLDLVAEIMGSAPRLADRLSRRPILLDAVLAPWFADATPPASVLAGELVEALAPAKDFEDVLDITRRWAKDRKFQLGVQVLHNQIDAEAAAPTLSDIGDILIRALQPEVEKDFARRYGRIPGAGLSVVALGRLGSREMTFASDLDLIFVYSDTAEDAVSDGAKALTPTVYFSRLAQRFLNALTARTAEGELYEVDIRLRPSGESGPIASSLQAFHRYQRESAWVWEHMALTRARVVSGREELRRDIETLIRDVLAMPRDPLKLAAEVADMRLRMAKTHKGESIWDIKHFRGGIVDVEFIAQYLQLRDAHAHPEILSQNTETALENLAAAGLLDPAMADDLVAAARLWHRLQGLIRMSFKEVFTEERASGGLKQALARAGRAPDFTALKATMEATAARVREIYAAVIEAPAHEFKGTLEEPGEPEPER